MVEISGLSPLARGTHAPTEREARKMRFIPAGAGNTGVFARSAMLKAVYPRWRGEHVLQAKPANGKNGLSPLARGTRAPKIGDPVTVRFIPAGAGNTLHMVIRLNFRSVYPRWRGEHRR